MEPLAYREMQKQQEKQPRQKTEEELNAEIKKQQMLEKMADIFISTCVPNWQFEVIDTVFAIDSHEQGFLSHLVESQIGTRVFGGANPGRAFDGVKNQLREQCLILGGDAVVSCQFEHRSASASGMFGSKQAIEIFAYGTVIRRTSSMT